MKKVVFSILLFTILISFISAPYGYDNPDLPQLREETFDDYTSDFFMPLNTSVGGNFSFNGGWLNNGLSIIDGDIYAQTGYFYNLTSLNITRQNLTILDNLIVEGDITANTFIGNSSMWSRSGTNVILTNIGDRVGIGTASPGAILHSLTSDGTGVAFLMTGQGRAGSSPFNATDGAAFVLSYNAVGNRQFTIGDSASGDSIRIIANALDGYNFKTDTRLNLNLGTSSTAVRFLAIAKHTGIWDGATGRFGIGVDPTTKLEVTASGGSDDLFAVSHDDANHGEYFMIKNNGNVGIGTTSPSETLTVAGNIFLQNDSDKLYFGQAKDVSINYNGSQTQFTNEVGSGAWVFPTGNVGIGTTTPQSALHIATNVGSGVKLERGGLDARWWGASNGPAYFGTISNDALNFQTNNNNRMTIASGATGGAVDVVGDFTAGTVTSDGNIGGVNATFTGKVGIGTTSPTHKLNVVGDLNVTGTIFTSALNISNSSFSFMDDENSSIKFSVQNKNSGTNATSLITAINDAGNIMGIGIGSSNYILGSLLMPNVTGLYSRSRGDSVFLNFYNQAFIWMLNPSDDNDAHNLVEIMRLDENGLNVTGNITGDNVFIPQYIFVHDNRTTSLSGAGVWANISFDQEVTDIKVGIGHTFNDNTNHTFTINEAGIYDITYDFDVIDTSVSASDIDVAARVIFINGTEIPGSVFETDIIKQNIENELSHTILAKFVAGDVIIFQFTADDADVEISTHGTFGDHTDSSTIEIKKIANLP